jgi:hypothetical protein
MLVVEEIQDSKAYVQPVIRASLPSNGRSALIADGDGKQRGSDSARRRGRLVRR